MNHIHQLTEDTIAVRSSRRYKDAFISKGDLCILYNYGGRDKSGDEHDAETDEFPLPPGNWLLLGLSTQLSEEDWRKVVEMQKTFGVRKYDAMPGDYQWCATYLESGATLLKSKGITTPVIILKLIK